MPNGTAPTVGSMIGELRSRVTEEGTAILRIESLRVHVRVRDTRSVFGRQDALVEPVGGSGRVWVSADRLAVLTNWEIVQGLTLEGRVRP